MGVNVKTPLIIAVKNGKLDCVKILFKYNADVEGKGDFEFALYPYPYFWRCVTPLCVAAAYGNLQILSCLVEMELISMKPQILSLVTRR